MPSLGIGDWMVIALPFLVPLAALILNYVDEKTNDGYISVGGGR